MELSEGAQKDLEEAERLEKQADKNEEGSQEGQDEEVQPEEEDEEEGSLEISDEEGDDERRENDSGNNEDEDTSWMDDEDQEGSDTSKGSKSVPLTSHIELRRKLKGQLSERDNELEELKKKIAVLESASSVGTQNQNMFTWETKQDDLMPIMDDFETDDEYRVAVTNWNRQQLQKMQESNRLQEQVEAQKKQLANAVDGHLKRAEEVIKKHNIDPEAYVKADENVRNAIGSVTENGDMVTDTLISKLGAGSEKVMFKLGRNKAYLEQLQAKLINDPTGLDAMVFLGEMKASLNGASTNINRKKSNASKPAKKIKGDVSQGSKATSLRKKYDKAVASGNTQSVREIWNQAKSAEIDVSNW